MTQAEMAQLIEVADFHAAQDLYRQGSYETCSVGCTIKSAVALGLLPPATSNDDHAALAAALGTTESVVLLQDTIYEGLHPEKARTWTPLLLRAIAGSGRAPHVNARIAARLARRLEADAIREDVRAVAGEIAGLYERRAAGHEPTAGEWLDAIDRADQAKRTKADSAQNAQAAAAIFIASGCRHSGDLFAAVAEQWVALERLWHWPVAWTGSVYLLTVKHWGSRVPPWMDNARWTELCEAYELRRGCECRFEEAANRIKSDGGSPYLAGLNTELGLAMMRNGYRSCRAHGARAGRIVEAR